MKKSIMIMMMAMAVCIAMTACGEKAGDNSETDVGMTEGWGIAGNLVMRADGEYRCASDKGYYYVTEDEIELKDGSFGRNIMYVDYATKQEVYLCSNAGCKHDTKDCTAVIADGNNECMPFYQGGKLYLLTKDYDQGNSVTTGFSADGSFGETPEVSPAILYSMNPDGTDRKMVYTFEKNLTLNSQVYGDDSGLYFITSKVKMEEMEAEQTYRAAVYDRKVVRLDLGSGKVSECCKLDPEEKQALWNSWNVVDCAGDKLVLNRTHYKSEMTESDYLDDDAFRDASKKATEEYAFLDLTNGKIDIKYQLPNEPYHEIKSKNGMLYVLREDEDQLVEVDLNTGKERRIVQDKALNGAGIFGSYGDMMEIRDAEGESMQMDLTDGKLYKGRLTDESLHWPLTILARFDDDFLVIYDYDAEKSELNNGGYEIHQNKLAFISKDKLYRGQRDWQKVKMVGKGA
ncbi:hypothetical protein ACPW7J_12735 [Ihubacter sp. rT4E-8]|uniref:hypothetical protein n=1 Tax=unclassified Ihubacter TaxID=2633299 RepID=UPI003C7C7764